MPKESTPKQHSEETFVKAAVDIEKRKSLAKIAAAGVGSLLSAKAPYVFAKNKNVLRVLGTHVTLQEELRQQAMSDLDIELRFEPKGR
jgi:putative spermidine/putrescine transport system substrate-binding protein